MLRTSITPSRHARIIAQCWDRFEIQLREEAAREAAARARLAAQDTPSPEHA